MESITLNGQAAATLKRVERAYGFVPNLIRELVENSPAVAEVYLTVTKLMGSASLTPKEQQAIILAVSTYNDCHYCKASHAKVGRMAGLTQEEIDTITAGDLPNTPRLRRLITASRRILGKRGWLSDEDIEEFESQGITRGQLYEIVALIALKTISNYVNHMAHTEIDPQFR